jgi:plastocyanin
MKFKYFSSLILTTFSILCILLISSSSCSKSNNTTPTVVNNGGGGGGGNGTTVNINIVGMAFPTSTTVKVGTIVTWVNKDGNTHTVTSDDGTTFNSGNMAANASFSYTANKAGSYPYHCNIHSSMTSTLIVNP